MIEKINKKRLIRTFCEFVKIDSISGEEEIFAKHLLKISKTLGHKTRLDNYNNLYIDLPAQGDKLLLNTHMDTVEPGRNIQTLKKKVNGKRYVVSGGNTILGADPKATIAAIFEVLYILKENDLIHRNIEIVLTCQEEQGNPTAQFIKTTAKYCIVPDRGTPIGEIITKSPEAQVFTIEFFGKKAYGTTNFRDGIHALASAVSAFSKIRLGNISNKTVVNIGKFNAGEMSSMVPDYCSFSGSCYSFSSKELQIFFEGLQQILNKTNKKFKTKSNIILNEHFPGYSIKRNNKVVKIAKEAICKTKLNPVFKKYQAVSNANMINYLGISSILLGYGVENQHTVEERISIENLISLTEVILNLIVPYDLLSS